MLKRLLASSAVVVLMCAAPVFANELVVSDFDVMASTFVTSGPHIPADLQEWADCQLVPDFVMGPSGQSFMIQWGRVDTAGEWAGGGVRFQPALAPATTDISAYNNISFFIFTPNVNTKATIKLNDYVGGVEHGGRVKLSDYVVTVSSSWQEVVIPLAAFKRDNPTLDLTKANNIVLVADVTNGLEYDTSGVVRIDNLKLSTQPRAPYNSLIYSGGDKGTSNVSDIPGDTLLWWDQAGSSATSNEVTVRVSAGYAEAWVVQPPVTNSATVGTTNYYAFQIRNDGNRADRITFSTQTVSGNAWQTRTFYDKDKSGTFSAGDDVCWDTIGLLPQSTHYFLVGIYVPQGAVNGSSTTVRLTAKDNFGSGANDSWPSTTNDDTITYDFSATCAGPSLTVVKSTDTATGKPGATVNYTLTVKNSGDASASNLVLVDVIPTNMELGGAASGASATISYYVGSSWTGTWSANATKIRWTWATVNSGGASVSGSYPAKIK